MKSKWILIFSILGLVLALSGVFYSKQWASSVGRVEIDKTLSAIETLNKMREEGAFDFELTPLTSDLPETAKKLSDFKGQIILLNFWASWCEPCIKEFPDMIGLVEKRPDVKIIAVNRDTKKEDAIKFIESFPEAKGKIHFFWDPQGEMTSLYGTEVLPESYLIGRDFKVLKKIIGIEDWDAPHVLKYLDTL